MTTLPSWWQKSAIIDFGSGFIRAAPLAASVQSNRKRNFEKANNEYRTRNNECRSKVFYLFILI
jgi:hypothetical protein